MALRSDKLTLLKSLTSSSHTGNTNEVVLFSGLIPAGRVLALDALEIFTGIGGTSNANNKTIRYRFDTAAGTIGTTVSGSATLVASFVFTTNNIRSGMDRIITCEGGLINSWRVSSSTTSMGNKYTAVNAADTVLTTNFAVDQYLIITGQLANSADSVYALSTIMNIIR